jgi:hypothetical protein
MAAPARTRQELLQAAARLFQWNLVGLDTGRTQLITRAQQHRLLHGADTAYVSCIKNHYRGPSAMARLWEDVLRHSRSGAVDMSDFAQGRLTRLLAAGRPELTDTLVGLDIGASCQAGERTRRLWDVSSDLTRRSEKAAPARTLPLLGSTSGMTLESAVLGWVSVFVAAFAPEARDPEAPLSPERAEVAVHALSRGAACDQAHRRASARSRVGFPSRNIEGGTGSWVALRAAVAVAEGATDPLAVARAWALQHDEWLPPRDEAAVAARLARTLFDFGRMPDALRALELACVREELAPELVEVAVDLCTSLLAVGDRERAERALPSAIRERLDGFGGAAGSRGLDPALSEALRQSLVDPTLGLTALRRVWFATYREEPPNSASGWLVAGALTRCLRESGATSEAGVVAILSRRMLDDPARDQEHRMRSLLVAAASMESEEATALDRQRLHSLLDELEGMLLRSPELACDPRIVRELAGISRVARRARVLFRPERASLMERVFSARS